MDSTREESYVRMQSISYASVCNESVETQLGGEYTANSRLLF
jgi:hypothetical protein